MLIPPKKCKHCHYSTLVCAFRPTPQHSLNQYLYLFVWPMKNSRSVWEKSKSLQKLQVWDKVYSNSNYLAFGYCQYLWVWESLKYYVAPLAVISKWKSPLIAMTLSVTSGATSSVLGLEPHLHVARHWEPLFALRIFTWWFNWLQLARGDH